MSLWPWDMDWWKPSNGIQNLVKAGALIAAEIDSLKRKEKQVKRENDCYNCGTDCPFKDSKDHSVCRHHTMREVK
jgi:ribosomal protein S14